MRLDSLIGWGPGHRITEKRVRWPTKLKTTYREAKPSSISKDIPTGRGRGLLRQMLIPTSFAFIYTMTTLFRSGNTCISKQLMRKLVHFLIDPWGPCAIGTPAGLSENSNLGPASIER